MTEFYNVTVQSEFQLRVIRFKWRELEARISELDGSHAEDVTYNLIQIADELTKPKYAALADVITSDGDIDWTAIFREVPELLKLARKIITPILVKTLKINGKKRSEEELQKYPQAFFILCLGAAYIANKDQYADLWRIIVVDFLKKKEDSTPEPQAIQKTGSTS